MRLGLRVRDLCNKQVWSPGMCSPDRSHNQSSLFRAETWSSCLQAQRIEQTCPGWSLNVLPRLRTCQTRVARKGLPYEGWVPDNVRKRFRGIAS